MFLTVIGFVLLCFLLVGAEHLIYKFLIPYSKRRPPGSLWRGKLVMFFSQVFICTCVVVHDKLSIHCADNSSYLNYKVKISVVVNG